jgi:chorismate synthase
MLSIPATKGFEFGSGFDGTKIPGSIHNDPFVKKEDGSLGTTSNFSGIREMIILGGVQGGITNGQDIYFNVAFKSVATIGKAQPSAQYDGSSGTLEAKGRHDPCVLPRAVPIVESMAAIVVMDLLMIQNGRSATKIIDATVPAVLKGELGKGNIA